MCAMQLGDVRTEICYAAMPGDERGRSASCGTRASDVYGRAVEKQQRVCDARADSAVKCEAHLCKMRTHCHGPRSRVCLGASSQEFPACFCMRFEHGVRRGVS
eukprot:1665824-Rhodomonas_salina.1